jgi:hypothetical protein
VTEATRSRRMVTRDGNLDMNPAARVVTPGGCQIGYMGYMYQPAVISMCFDCRVALTPGCQIG